MAQEIGYYDGRWGRPDELMVPLEDRGFLFGEGVYEVMHCINHVFWLLEEHLDRLEYSLREMEMPMPMPRAELVNVLREGIARVDAACHTVYLQVTRGAAPRTHDYIAVQDRSVLMMVIRPWHDDTEEWLERGGAAVTFPDIRWQRCDIKTLNLIPNAMATTAAKRAGAQGAIFVRDGIVTEGASQTACIAKDGVLYTRPLSHQVLPSITRQYLLQHAAEWGIPVREEEISLEQLLAADEVMLFSTSRCPLAVVSVDGKQIGNGKVGPMARQIWTHHQADVLRICGPVKKA